jgi:hypothetical protein
VLTDEGAHQQLVLWLFCVFNARTKLTPSGAPSRGSINISWEQAPHHRTKGLTVLSSLARERARK